LNSFILAIIFILIPLQVKLDGHSPYIGLTIDHLLGYLFGIAIVYYFVYIAINISEGTRSKYDIGLFWRAWSRAYLVKDWLAGLQFLEDKGYLLSSLTDRPLGIPIVQSDEKGSFSLVRRQTDQGWNLIFTPVCFRRLYSIDICFYSFLSLLI
jgi:hypothetical protein